MPILILIMTFWIADSVAAQASPYQQNWEPNRYVVVCEEGKACPLNQEQASKAADKMSRAVSGIKTLPFDAPRDWGPRINQGKPDDHIKLFQGPTGIAGVVPRCSAPKKNAAHVLVGPGAADPSIAEYLSFYFFSHEAFHLIQGGYPLFNSVDCGKVPGWIVEGSASAIGQEVMRQQYPASWPSVKNDKEARNFAGLRRYNEPLPRHQKSYSGEDMGSGDHPSYRTSSFWSHIANAYHHGSYDYLHRYFKRGITNGDWVAWLSSNLKEDLGMELGAIFSGFLADFSGWGDPSYPGAFFGRKDWLVGAFDGCTTVYLDKNEKHQFVDLEILPLSGACIEVRVSALGDNGLQPGDAASIQVAGEIRGGAGKVEGLHLSLASSNDSSKFHCAGAAQAGSTAGISQCIMSGAAGKVLLPDSLFFARVWNVRPDKPDQKPVITETSGSQSILVQSPATGKGELVNLYTVSYTPPGVTSEDTDYGGQNPARARIHFVLNEAREYASMGTGSKTEAPDIEGSLPIVFDVRQATFTRAKNRKEGDQYIGTEMAEGTMNPCHITVNLRNSKTNDSMNLVMMHSGAITPGEYTFANWMDFMDIANYYVPEGKVPGMILGSFALGPGNPESDGESKSFRITDGTLSIRSLSGSLAAGDLTAYGAVIKRGDSGGQAPWVIKEQRAVAMKFALDFRHPMAFGQERPYACFSPN